MNRVKVAVSLALLMLGLAGFDAAMNYLEQDNAIPAEEEVRPMSTDGLPLPH